MSLESRPPVIILGAHRSGTSLVVRLLERRGYFAGAWKESNAEARLFLRMNRLLLNKAGARWDRPEPFIDLIESNELSEMYSVSVSKMLHGPLSIAFLGFRRYVAGGIAALSEPWGWKDPRNTFTLPFWLGLFPDARVVEVRRHGVDVAASLSLRNGLLLERDRTWFERSAGVFVAGSSIGPLGRASRVGTVQGAFDVWRSYVEEAERQRSRVIPDRWLVVRYEDLLQDPETTVASLASFAGCRVTDGFPDVDTSRMYAHRENAELVRFAESRSDVLERFGY